MAAVMAETMLLLLLLPASDAHERADGDGALDTVVAHDLVRAGHEPRALWAVVKPASLSPKKIDRVLCIDRILVARILSVPLVPAVPSPRIF